MAKKVLFSDVAVGFSTESLKGVSGLPGYGGRGVLLDVDTCYLHEMDDRAQFEAITGLYELMRSYDLGARKIIFGRYGGDNIRSTLMDHGVDDSAVIIPFYVGPASGGVFPHDWFGRKIPTVGASEDCNSKIWLRKKGNPSIFPYHKIVGVGDNYTVAIEDVMQQSPTGMIIVKLDGGASGAGMPDFSDVEAAERHIKRLLSMLVDSGKSNPEVIIEVKHSKQDGSLQINIPRRGPVTLNGVTMQYVDGKVHKGNLLTSNGKILVFDKRAEALFHALMPVFVEMQKLGYWGFASVDFIDVEDGRLLVVECNARITASYFALDFMRQLLRKRPQDNIVISMYHCNTPHLRSWGDMIDIIGADIYDGKRGVIPMMPIPGVKTGIIAIQSTVETAEAQCREVTRRLESNCSEIKIMC